MEGGGADREPNPTRAPRKIERAVIGIGIHALDEEPVEFAAQAGWKQQRHTALIDLESPNRVEAVFRPLKSHDALGSRGPSLQ